MVCISVAEELARVRDGIYAVSCGLLPHECDPLTSSKWGCRCEDGWAAARVAAGAIVEVIGRDSCEPEDALLVRDFAWVVERLEADRARLAAAEARAEKAEGERDRYQSALKAISFGCSGTAEAIANAALALSTGVKP